MSVALPHRVYLVALVSDPTARPWVIGLCQRFGDGGEAESLSCSTELASAAAPSGPVVGHAMSVPVSQRVHDLLTGIADAGQVPAGAVYAICGITDGIVTKSNHPDQSIVGMVWDTAGSLARVGLAFRLPPDLVPPE